MVTIRLATEHDLEAIIGLHAQDALGGHGDGWTPETAPIYTAAFTNIANHPDHTLFVAEREGRVVGTYLLSIMPGLTTMGATYAELRSVQVDPTLRSLGIGAQIVAHAEHEARARGARFLELTSNLKRLDAHRFYERLGFAKSHAGFKKQL